MPEHVFFMDARASATLAANLIAGAGPIRMSEPVRDGDAYRFTLTQEIDMSGVEIAARMLLESGAITAGRVGEPGAL